MLYEQSQERIQNEESQVYGDESDNSNEKDGDIYRIMTLIPHGPRWTEIIRVIRTCAARRTLAASNTTVEALDLS
jgi:hypothetical protein